jgi:hypothetical protein
VAELVEIQNSKLLYFLDTTHRSPSVNKSKMLNAGMVAIFVSTDLSRGTHFRNLPYLDVMEAVQAGFITPQYLALGRNHSTL